MNDRFRFRIEHQYQKSAICGLLIRPDEVFEENKLMFYRFVFVEKDQG